MLKTTKEQEEHIESMLSEQISVIDISDDGVYIDDFITYDQMAQVVDYLRSQAPKKELFEKCWIAYNRKGIKKKALEYWKKLTDSEKDNVLPHIKAYVSSRELQYQKDFERYLRDKVFLTVVYSGNSIVYDPTKLGKDETAANVYMPSGNYAITWNDELKEYIYIGYYNYGYVIADGYDAETRPDGARLVLNNARGTLVWSKEFKTWNKI